MPELKNNIFESIEAPPKEHYTFHIDPKETLPVEKHYIGMIKKQLLRHIIDCIILIILGIFAHKVLVSFVLGVASIIIIGHVKQLSFCKNLYASNRYKFSKTLYDYTLYDNFLIVWISSDDSIKQIKVRLDEIQKAQVIENILVMEIDGQLFLMKKDELVENSYFLTICNKNNGRKVISI